MIRLVLILIALAGPAKAAIFHATGCEQGDCASPKVWNAVSGTIDNEPAATTPTNGDPDNDWSIEIDPAAGNTEYVGQIFASSHEGVVHIFFRPKVTPSVERTVAVFESAGALTQCFMTFGPDRKIRVYHGDDTRECAQTQSTDGTACTYTEICVGGAQDGQCCSHETECGGTPAACTGGTCATICDELNEGEATCAEATFAKSAALSDKCVGGTRDGLACSIAADCTGGGTCTPVWYELVLTQDTAQALEGDVQCGLWVDGRNRGTRIRPQGACNGGADDGTACSQDSDCASSDCQVTTIAPSTHIYLGVTDTAASAIAYNLDDIVLANALTDELYRLRTRDIHPDGMGAGGVTWDTTGCTGTTGEHECVDDTIGTAANDGASTYLGGGGGDVDVFTLESMGSLDTGESILALTASCIAREQTDNANVDKTIAYTLTNSAETLSVAGTDKIIDDYGDAVYYLTPHDIFTAKPGGGAWDVSAVDGARFRLDQTGTSGTSYRIHVTDCAAQVLIRQPLPELPDVLEDHNGAGLTVGYMGDSRFSDKELEDAVNARWDQADNIIVCAQGGRRSAHFSDSAGSLLDGISTADVPCTVIRGEVSPMDYVFFDIGVNDWGAHPHYPINGQCFQSWCVGGASAGAGCKADGDCPGGACGGPQHGDACVMPTGYYARKGPNTTYCVYGPDFVTKTLAPVPTPCGSCAGDPLAGFSATCSMEDPVVSWCMPGVFDSPDCPGGLCVHRNEPTYWEWEVRKFLDTAKARTGSKAVRVILAATYDTKEINPATAGINCFFSDARGFTRYMRAAFHAFADEYEMDIVDMGCHFRNVAAPRSPDGLLRDHVHPLTAPGPYGYYGDDAVAELWEHCLEQTPNPCVDCSRLQSTPTPTP